MMKEKMARSLQEHTLAFAETFQRQEADLTSFAERLLEAFHQGGRLLVFGNGPLGAIAGLIANQFLYRLSLERPLLPALALSHDVALATALTRDGQPEAFFARQLRAVAAPGDVVLALVDSGRDEAVEQALEAARQLGCSIAVLLQRRGELSGEPPDFLFRIETDSIPRGTEGALFFGHLLCELVEGELFGI